MPNAVTTAGTNPAQNGRRRHPHSFWWYLKWVFICLQLVVFCVIMVTLAIGKGIYDELEKIVPDVRYITSRNKAEATRIYAADGSLLAEIKGEQRAWVPLDNLRVTRRRGTAWKREDGHLVNATLSIEDARFYTHPGMDAKRIVGAALANFKSGGVEQGGSTITEQLAKNIYLTRKRTFSRRLQTALLSLQLEKRFSKDEILELYLNEIYYGNRAYGCEAAAHTYFGKSAKDLSLSEAALLAGLPQQPTRLDPFRHLDRAKARRRLILREMLQNHKINYTQYLEAVKDESVDKKISAARARLREARQTLPKYRYPYFVSYTLQYLNKKYNWNDDYLLKNGLKIYTSLDPKIQDIAERALIGRLNELGVRKLQGAMVAIDPWTGRVVAMVGGRNYYDTKANGQFNRATQALRQPGSTFKPYIYATAMEQGYSPYSTVLDKTLYVCNQSECGPGASRSARHEIRNYDRIHHGRLNLLSAIGQSNNVAATKTLLKVGIGNAIQKAHLMGISTPMRPYPTLALGTSEVNLLEHTSAFGVFATRGLRADPVPVIRIDNYNGETIIEQPIPVRAARVLSVEAGNKMWDMLRYVVTSGTGKNAAIRGVDVIGKTGTTSSNKDVWFMGATKDLACGVWMGYDTPSQLYGSAGGRWCAPAWRDFMASAIGVWRQRRPMEKLVEDARATDQQRLLAAQYKQMMRVRICDETGLAATSECPSTHMDEFSSASGIPRRCYVHQPTDVTPRRLTDPDREPQNGDLGFNPNSDRSSRSSSPARRDNGNDSPSDNDQTKPSQRENTPNTGDGDGRVLDDNIPGGRLDTPEDNSPAPDDLPARRGQLPGSTRARPVSLDRREAPQTEQGEVVLNICADSGDLATSRCPVTLQRFFAASQVPTRRCRVH